MGAVNEARRAAHASLVACLANDKYVNLEINSVLGRTKLTGADRGLYSAIVYGTVERLLTIDFIISKLSQRKLCDIDSDTLCAIRIGICQIGFMDKIPPHAAVSESVELAPKKSKGFVNAILRSYLRRPPELPKKKNGENKYLSIKYSVPEELCALFVRDYGDETEEIFEAFFEKKDISVRINNLKNEAWQKAEELGAKKSPLCPDIAMLPSFDGVLDGIDKGYWFVQDTASSLCANVLGAKPGETVVDACAAPGGKSFSVALSMKNQGKLYSFDLHDNKLSLIRSGANKLGITIIEASARDAREPLAEIIGKADKVLCDAPCSGFGVIGKKPDIKYKSVKAAEGLPAVQKAVLCGASAYVRPGGVLVYSTCTLNKKENEEVVKAFLAEDKDFNLCPFEAGARNCEGMLTLLPNRDNTDGFFICKMVRAGGEAK